MRKHIMYDVDVLEIGIMSQAEKNPMPKRFIVNDAKSPTMEILDTKTGKSLDVPMYAYGEVRKVLNFFFGDGA